MRILRYTYPNGRASNPVFAVNPCGGFEAEIERLLSATFGESQQGYIPVDLYEDAANTYVRAELPGVTREDISVEVVEGSLKLAASRKLKTGEGEQAIALNRSVPVPDGTQVDRIAANYENGVLTVTLPKAEAVKPKRFTVPVN